MDTVHRGNCGRCRSHRAFRIASLIPSSRISLGRLSKRFSSLRGKYNSVKFINPWLSIFQHYRQIIIMENIIFFFYYIRRYLETKEVAERNYTCQLLQIINLVIYLMSCEAFVRASNQCESARASNDLEMIETHFFMM